MFIEDIDQNVIENFMEKIALKIIKKQELLPHDQFNISLSSIVKKFGKEAMDKIDVQEKAIHANEKENSYIRFYSAYTTKHGYARTFLFCLAFQFDDTSYQTKLVFVDDQPYGFKVEDVIYTVNEYIREVNKNLPNVEFKKTVNAINSNYTQKICANLPKEDKESYINYVNKCYDNNLGEVILNLTAKKKAGLSKLRDC